MFMTGMESVLSELGLCSKYVKINLTTLTFRNSDEHNYSYFSKK